MRGLEKVDMKRGQIYRQIYRQTDIATTRKNRPKGRFFENTYLIPYTKQYIRVVTLPNSATELGIRNTKYCIVYTKLHVIVKGCFKMRGTQS